MVPGGPTFLEAGRCGGARCPPRRVPLSDAPLPFPAGRTIPDSAGLRRAALTLRPVIDGDLGFLRDLYATTRADEMAISVWPDDAKLRFVEQQFALQHRHLLTHHPDADYWIVGRRGSPVGRLYVDRHGSPWRVLDITLLPEARGTGAGSALLRWLQRAAARAGAAIDLHVAHHNPRAAALYARLGFVTAICASATHARMVWSGKAG